MISEVASPVTDIFMPGHIERSGTVRVTAPLADAFLLFTPEGERRWVPGWSPEYLHPRDGRQIVGAVFRTAADGEETLWLIAGFDPAAGVAEYVRITPGSRMGTVSIRAEAMTESSTLIHVTYRMTALGPDGNRVLDAFDLGFDAMMREWASGVANATRT
jgi:hypothetical protein